MFIHHNLHVLFVHVQRCFQLRGWYLNWGESCRQSCRSISSHWNCGCGTPKEEGEGGLPDSPPGLLWEDMACVCFTNSEEEGGGGERLFFLGRERERREREVNAL